MKPQLSRCDLAQPGRAPPASFLNRQCNKSAIGGSLSGVNSSNMLLKSSFMNIERIKTMTFFLILAALGFIVSLWAHITTFTGFDPNVLPWVWILHGGIFVVFVPAIICGKKAETETPKKDLAKLIFQQVPVWLRGVLGIFGAYVFFNFFFTIFVLQEGGVTGVIDGQYVLHSHGEIIRELTEAEYIKHEGYGIRIFSGHWMAFYLISFLMLLSHIRRNTLRWMLAKSNY